LSPSGPLEAHDITDLPSLSLTLLDRLQQLPLSVGMSPPDVLDLACLMANPHHLDSPRPVESSRVVYDPVTVSVSFLM
jgi:hypothetical protein